MRRLGREAVADHDERSLLGGMPVLTDVDAASRAVWDPFEDASVHRAGLSVWGGAFPSLRWRGGRDRRSG